MGIREKNGSSQVEKGESENRVCKHLRERDPSLQVCWKAHRAAVRKAKGDEA